MPKSYTDDNSIRLVRRDGTKFVAEEEARGNRFDRVSCRWYDFGFSIEE